MTETQVFSAEPAPGFAASAAAPIQGESAPLPLAWVCLLAGLATSGLLWLSYFPVACGWLGWVALVPLLGLVRSAAPRRYIYLSAWASGLAFFWPVLQWMRVADYRMYYTWAGLATYCSLYWPAAVWLLRRLDRRSRLPLIVTVPSVWVGLEYFRASFPHRISVVFSGTHPARFLAHYPD